MTTSMSQASRRNFQTPRRLCNVYSSAKVGSRVYRSNGLVKRLDTHQVSNINKDAFPQGFHYSEVFSDSALFFKTEVFGSLPAVRTIVPSRLDAHLTTVPPVRMPVKPSIIRPDNVQFPSGPLLYQEAIVPACFRPDGSAARPDAPQ